MSKNIQEVSRFRRRWALVLLTVLGVLAGRAEAQDSLVSQLLTDAIYRGDGVIDLLKDVSGTELEAYISEGGGRLLLGVDVNEDNSGNENSDSLGVAIRQVQLSISTSAGDFTFSDFLTSTTATLREAGSETADEFFTLFGTGGSSQITGGGGFNLAAFDDVLWIDNISLGGATILSAELSVTFLDIAKGGATDAESFFDFSGGFEDFALLSRDDAILLEDAAIGTEAAPAGVAYSEVETVTTQLLADEPTPVENLAPAAPSPPLWIVGLLACFLVVRNARK